MMPSGWAGSKGFEPLSGLNCAPCAVTEDRSVPAYTQINGTVLCLAHAKKWVGHARDMTLVDLFKLSLQNRAR